MLASCQKPVRKKAVHVAKYKFRISLLKTFFFCTNHRGQRVVSVVRFVTHIQCLLHHLVQRNPSQMTNCLCFRQQNTVSKSFPFYLSQVRSNPIAPPLDVLNVIVISKLLAQICRSGNGRVSKSLVAHQIDGKRSSDCACHRSTAGKAQQRLC